jgi:hypothetical protein
MLIELFGKTCALQFYPSLTGVCSSDVEAADPFGEGVIVLTLGLVVLAVACIPISFYNLDDNMIIQVGATFGMCALLLIWIVYFCVQGLQPASLPAVGSDASKILGIVVFNYAFVTSLPSWVNEKVAHACSSFENFIRIFHLSLWMSYCVRYTFDLDMFWVCSSCLLFCLQSPSAPVVSSVWQSVLLATCITCVIGVFGALAYAPFFDTNNTILSMLFQSGGTFIRVTFFAFPIIVNLTSIPITLIIIRYNLLSNQLVSKRACCSVCLSVYLSVFHLFCVLFAQL